MSDWIRRHRVSFVGCDRQVHHVYGCSLGDRSLLASTLDQVAQVVDESPAATIGELYDGNIEFQALAHEALKLCQLGPKWLDLDMLTQMLLPWTDEEGESQRPILAALNFPPPSDGVEGKAGTVEEAIAATWSATGDLESALKHSGIESPLPWNQLQEVIAAYAEILNEQRVKSDPKFAEEQRVEKFKEAKRLHDQQKESQAEGPAQEGAPKGGFPTPEEVELILQQVKN